jgi:ubiquinone/menaquinone biosynthesis C-methylase UbiE
MAYVESLGVPSKREKALDFGCGAGRLTQPLADHYREVVGVDIAASMIDLAGRHNRHPQRCRFLVNARDDLAMFEDDTFDLVYSNITLQHMEPRFSKRYIAEFVRVLRPGGLAIFQIPSERKVPARASGRMASFRKRLAETGPAPLVGLYRRCRTRLDIRAGRATFDCYEVPREVVIAELSANGAVVLDVVADLAGGPAVEGFRYCATKR